MMQSIRYITAALEPGTFPTLLDPRGKPLPEIALAGRSNAGKSTFLNLLCGRKDIAKVSATPGKTQRLQFFCADEKIVLVDLPGFGFAKVPLKLQQEWSRGIDEYLNSSPNLRLVLLILDCRRVPSDEDLSLIAWANARSIPLLPVFTKTDMLSATERKKVLSEAVHSLAPYKFLDPIYVPDTRQRLWSILTRLIYETHR